MKCLPFKMVFVGSIAVSLFPVTLPRGQEIDSISRSGAVQSIDTAPVSSIISPDSAKSRLFAEGREAPLPDSKPGGAVSMEGVQVSNEPGDKRGEKVVTYYFIFRDKPSGYSYEVKLKEKKIVFLFDGAAKSEAQVPGTIEPPIETIVIEEHAVDSKKKADSIQPEYRKQVRVIFTVSAMPRIQVHDESSIVSFSYIWSNDSVASEQYTIKDPSPKMMLWSSAAVAGIGGGILMYYFLRPKPHNQEALISIDDLPIHDPEKPDGGRAARNASHGGTGTGGAYFIR